MNATTATVAAAEMLTDRMNLLIRASRGADSTPSVTDQTIAGRNGIARKDQSADNRQGQYDVRDRPKIGNAATGHRIPHKPSQPSRSCVYVPFFYRGETAKLKPYDFLSHRFPLYFALPQAISTANVYAGGQTG